MPNCIVRGCVRARKKSCPSIILHSFPREPEKIKQWLQQTGQYGSDIDNMVVKVFLGKVNDAYRMCSLHFTHDCYHYDGYRKTLKKNAVPTIFNIIKPATAPSTFPVSTNLPPLPGTSISSTEQLIPSAPPIENRKSSWSDTGRALQIVHPKLLSQPTIKQMTLVPVVPQGVFFQARGVRSSVNTQPTANSRCEATQMYSALPSVSQQSSAISEFIASPRGGKQEQLTPNTSASVIFVQKPSSLTRNPDLPLDTQLRSEATSSSNKLPSSTKPSGLIISLSSASSAVISTSGFDKSNSKPPTTPPVNIPLTVIGKSKPCPMTVLPISGTVPAVTQTPPTSGLTQNPPCTSVVHSPLKTPTPQTLIPGSEPASKKRKFSPNPIILPSPCINQPSDSTAKHYFVASSAPLIQPSSGSRLFLKPLMVDKGVNTDYSTNRRSCCIATDPMYRRRNARTQTKIYTKHRKIMCNLLVSSKQTKSSDLTVSPVSPEDVGFSDCSASTSSDDDSDPCDDVESVHLDLVKVEIFSDPEVDLSISSDIKLENHVKKETEDLLSPTDFKGSFTAPGLDSSNLKVEPNVKTEVDQSPISTPSQNIIDFVSQHLKIEKISSIPNKPVSPTSWETSAIQTDEEPEDPSDSSFYVNELSEDEDESFLVPSEGEDEDDVKQVFQDLDSPVENPVEEEKYIVFESCLKKLIMMIPCMSKSKCTSPLTQYRKETIGSYLSIEVRCRSGHTSLLWESQPRHGYEPLGNVLLSAAVLCSGSSFVKSQHMFKLLNVKSIDKASYYRHQSMYLYPAIRHHWREEQKAVIRSVQERPLCLAGDRQLDNPGFSAKYSIYSLMDVASKKICSLSVEPVTPQVTLEGLEKVGFQKAMGELQTMNAKVKMVVTDRSIAIQEILKDEYPGIAHKFDLWHLSKSIGNEVLMAAKHKDCEILYQWVEAIKNHIWWSSCTCCNNPDLLIQKWKSVIQHVANVHRWDSDSDCKACHHPPLPKEVVNNTNWLEEGSAAHEELKKIVENSNLLKDLKELSFLCHAGELEIYRTTCLKYRPKSLHFFVDSMVARTQLAALDHNRNVHRVKEVLKNASSKDELGTMTRSIDVSKGEKSWIIKALYEPTCQNFLFDIMNDVIALVKEEKTLS
ncbi:uncharacterized protein RB166_014992 [Leptodactylus fuscus]|uniref:uncharacterized protein LOC142213205 n=1 Tax=Leptodactylus fuscus TaxID=238119 RepID=UPI003F4EAF2C